MNDCILKSSSRAAERNLEALLHTEIEEAFDTECAVYCPVCGAEQDMDGWDFDCDCFQYLHYGRD